MCSPKKWKERDTKQYNYLEYNDVTKNAPKNKYIRDPLNPIYQFRDDNG